ncbi:hypothetical protein C8R45DRAFT_926991 [Mycena sanguinolenta]|nr:hypothetical protein C8R45DRAFT_926991 [Mycena sanguinolenta]
MNNIWGRGAPETEFLRSLERRDRTGVIREDDSPKELIIWPCSLPKNITATIKANLNFSRTVRIEANEESDYVPECYRPSLKFPRELGTKMKTLNLVELRHLGKISGVHGRKSNSMVGVESETREGDWTERAETKHVPTKNNAADNRADARSEARRGMMPLTLEQAENCRRERQATWSHTIRGHRGIRTRKQRSKRQTRTSKIEAAEGMQIDEWKGITVTCCTQDEDDTATMKYRKERATQLMGTHTEMLRTKNENNALQNGNQTKRHRSGLKAITAYRTRNTTCHQTNITDIKGTKRAEVHTNRAMQIARQRKIAPEQDNGWRPDGQRSKLHGLQASGITRRSGLSRASKQKHIAANHERVDCVLQQIAYEQNTVSQRPVKGIGLSRACKLNRIAANRERGDCASQQLEITKENHRRKSRTSGIMGLAENRVRASQGVAEARYGHANRIATSQIANEGTSASQQIACEQNNVAEVRERFEKRKQIEWRATSHMSRLERQTEEHHSKIVKTSPKKCSCQQLYPPKQNPSQIKGLCLVAATSSE